MKSPSLLPGSLVSRAQVKGSALSELQAQGSSLDQTRSVLRVRHPAVSPSMTAGFSLFNDSRARPSETMTGGETLPPTLVRAVAAALLSLSWVQRVLNVVLPQATMRSAFVCCRANSHVGVHALFSFSFPSVPSLLHNVSSLNNGLD